LPDITLRDVAKETSFFIGNVFTDDDGDGLTYEISVASAEVASARIIGDSMLIMPIAAGKTTLTLTADDSNTGRTSFPITLIITQNHAPIIDGLITDATLIPFSVPVVIDLMKYTSDAEDDTVTFDLQTSESGIVNAAINGNMLTIDPQYHGQVNLFITASDPYLAKSTAIIHVTVEQKYAPKKDGQLLVYPNPTSDILWYSYVLNDETASVNVRIVNSIGKIMYQSPEERQTGGTYYDNIDISNWNTGMYIVQYIKDGKVVDTKKMVKQ